MNVTIDCAAMETREDLHRIVSEALSFPACYGNNLDALHDMLTSLSGTIRLENWEIAEEKLGKYGIAAKKAITHAALENKRLTVIL
ncbi:MAG: barstar family protein [Oscillospiraceae bacterium]|nr:barstar family protein [Oscillospiraceae bacterium]